jgi:hypothetical protein
MIGRGLFEGDIYNLGHGDGCAWMEGACTKRGSTAASFFSLLTGAIAEAIRQNLLLGGKAYRKTTQSTESTSALRLLFGCARPVEPLLAILTFYQPIPAISEAPG